MKFSANLASFKKPLKKIEIVSLVIFAVFLLFPFKIPASLAKIINNPLGVLIIFIIAVVLFVKAHIIVSILFLMVAYELIRRSGAAGKIKPANYYNPSTSSTSSTSSTVSSSSPQMNPLPGVPEINKLNNNYTDSTLLYPIIADQSQIPQPNALPNYTMSPDKINNYASIGMNSKEMDRQYQQHEQPNLLVGSTLEEQIINERIPAEALHTSNDVDTSGFVPVYDNFYYDVSPI